MPFRGRLAFCETANKLCWESIVPQPTRILKSLANTQWNESGPETKSNNSLCRDIRRIRCNRYYAFCFCNQICLATRLAQKWEQRFLYRRAVNPPPSLIECQRYAEKLDCRYTGGQLRAVELAYRLRLKIRKRTPLWFCSTIVLQRIR